MTTALHQYPPFELKYRRITQIGEGSFGKVYLAEKLGNQSTNNENQDQINQLNSVQSKPISKEYLAVKRLKPHLRKKLHSDPITHIQNFPQVSIMRNLSFRSILELKEIVRFDKGYEIDHYLVLPFGIELLELLKHKEISLSREMIRSLIKQLVQAIAYLHSKQVMHRDVKPDNVYLMRDGTLTLGDFSISTPFTSPQQQMVEQSEENKLSQHTLNVTTRNYRAPEVIYGSKDYNESIDIWSLGCTIGELILGQVLFPGSSDIHQLELIFSIMGHPQDLWPQAEQLPFFLSFDNSKPPIGLHNLIPADHPLIDLLYQLLQLNPLKRPTALQILTHPYFEGDTSLAEKQLSKICYYLHEKKIGEWVKGKGKK